jgi:hypothetical protein
MEPESFFRSYQVLGYSRNNAQFIEHEGSSPCSQQSTNCPYPELHQSGPGLPNYFFKAHFKIILTSTSRSSKCSSPLRFHHQNPVCSSPFPPAPGCTRTANLTKITKTLQLLLPGPGSRCETHTYRIRSSVTFEIWRLRQSRP